MQPDDKTVLGILIGIGVLSLMLALGQVVPYMAYLQFHWIAKAMCLLAQVTILILLGLAHWEVTSCQSKGQNIYARNTTMIALFLLLNSICFYLFRSTPKSLTTILITSISLLSLANTIWATQMGDCSTSNTEALYFLTLSVFLCILHSPTFPQNASNAEEKSPFSLLLLSLLLCTLPFVLNTIEQPIPIYAIGFGAGIISFLLIRYGSGSISMGGRSSPWMLTSRDGNTRPNRNRARTRPPNQRRHTVQTGPGRIWY